MKREIITTKDGSKTIHLPEINEHYHSSHGAIQEALHVFIESGWREIEKKELNILEIGFGTGLNIILTFIEAEKDKKTVHYTGLEAFPISDEEKNALDYSSNEIIQPYSQNYHQLHQVEWDKEVQISDQFYLTKVKKELADFEPKANHYDLIYFDAFGPRVQPEMWTLEVFKKMFNGLNDNGILVTYSAKGEVRRNMISSGFDVEKIPGPPGKREMLRARK